MKNVIIENVVAMEKIEEDVKQELSQLLQNKKIVDVLLTKGKYEYKKMIMIELSKLVKKYIDKSESVANKFVEQIKRGKE